MKRLLSKSSVNLYLECPLKWKYVYIDKIPSKSSPIQERGIKIHSHIENIYKKIKLVKKEGEVIPEIQVTQNADLNNFIGFEKKRIASCVNGNGEFDIKYFNPLFQELKLQDEELGLKGIVDAVYVNPKDDGIIIIDWKTGKFHPDKLDDYRFELAVYAELLRTSGKVKEIKYWGIYFSDADKLFFEKIDSKYIEKMHKVINDVREEIEKGNFPPKENQYCYNCQFKLKCSLYKNGS